MWSGWKCPTRWHLVGREGLNVGKVAKQKIGQLAACDKNALTCMFRLLKIDCNNVLQLFRHLGASGGVWRPCGPGAVQLSDT